MTCTTISGQCNALGHTEKRPETVGSGDRRETIRALARLFAVAGERLFHYRYVRAELIERALEHDEQDRGDRT